MGQASIIRINSTGINDENLGKRSDLIVLNCAIMPTILYFDLMMQHQHHLDGSDR